MRLFYKKYASHAFFGSRVYVFKHIMNFEIFGYPFSNKQEHHQKNFGKMKKFPKKKGSKNSIRSTEKKERIESKLWVTFKKLNFAMISLKKEVFNCFAFKKENLCQLCHVEGL